MHTPSNIAYYVQYADIMYTIGGTHAAGHRADVIANDYRTAQSYYAAAVRMSEGQNIRALYGLCASTSQLSGLKVPTAVSSHTTASTQCFSHICFLAAWASAPSAVPHTSKHNSPKCGHCPTKLDIWVTSMLLCCMGIYTQCTYIWTHNTGTC